MSDAADPYAPIWRDLIKQVKPKLKTLKEAVRVSNERRTAVASTQSPQKRFDDGEKIDTRDQLADIGTHDNQA